MGDARVRETVATKRERAIAIDAALATAYPRSTCALRHEGPFQLLVATVLSAQTTDLAVNAVTPTLFHRFPDAAAMAMAPPGAIEQIIDSIGLWRAKARHLRGLSRALMDEHDGAVPHGLEALTRLPGVGKKTATAVLATAFGVAAGITVDTHMLRINKLLGLSNASDAVKMSHDLERLLPNSSWRHYTHRIIDHGRLVCVALRPRCGVCPLSQHCRSFRSPAAGYRPTNDDAEPASASGLSWRQIAD